MIYTIDIPDYLDSLLTKKLGSDDIWLKRIIKQAAVEQQQRDLLENEEITDIKLTRTASVEIRTDDIKAVK